MSIYMSAKWNICIAEVYYHNPVADWPTGKPGDFPVGQSATGLW